MNKARDRFRLSCLYMYGRIHVVVSHSAGIAFMFGHQLEFLVVDLTGDWKVDCEV